MSSRGWLQVSISLSRLLHRRHDPRSSCIAGVCNESYEEIERETPRCREQHSVRHVFQPGWRCCHQCCATRGACLPAQPTRGVPITHDVRVIMRRAALGPGCERGPTRQWHAVRRRQLRRSAWAGGLRGPGGASIRVTSAIRYRLGSRIRAPAPRCGCFSGPRVRRPAGYRYRGSIDCNSYRDCDSRLAPRTRTRGSGRPGARASMISCVSGAGRIRGSELQLTRSLDVMIIL